MIVHRDDIADSRVVRLVVRADVGKQIRELRALAGAQIDAQDAREPAVGAAVLQQRALWHRALQQSPFFARSRRRFSV